MQDIAFYSFLLGAAANIVLLLILMVNSQKNKTALLLASALTISAIWNILLAINTKVAFINGVHYLPLEALRYSIWTLLIISLSAPTLTSALKHVASLCSLAILAISISIAIHLTFFEKTLFSFESGINNIIFLLIISIIIGIYSIESLYRSTSKQQRWSIKLLCLGIVGIFIYDLCIFSYLLLFHDVNLLIWSTRGIVSAISIPLIALAIARNPNWSLNIFVSRQVVTTSFTLFLCSIYLAALVFASIYVRSIAGDLADFFLALLIFASLIFLLLLLSSKSLRYQVSTFISKHFFKNKYDYRVEWLKLINTISNLDSSLSLQEKIIKVLADLAQTNGGILWSDNSNHDFAIDGQWNMGLDENVSFNHSHPIVQSLASGNIVIFDSNTNNEYTPPPTELNSLSKLWLAIPLIHEDKLNGFVVLEKTEYNEDLNWEDLDIFKTVGRQLGSYLMEHAHANALSEAKQFEAFHQTTTFIIHDLRNLISQQSLLVQNAAKHKNKPEFIDDMIETIANSVSTMQNLISNLHADSQPSTNNSCTLSTVLQECAHAFSNSACKINLLSQKENLLVKAKHEDLLIQIGHILRNAQQANSSEIYISTSVIDDLVEIVFDDNGDGMSQDFIDNKLFKPFYTTKGASGMGIGAYEVRKYAREIGGDGKVRSQVGKGTEFMISLPIVQA